MNEPSNGTMYTMVCCRDHHEYSTWTKKPTTLVWMNLPMVQCMLWSVVETIMNIQPGLKKTPHWYEPSNGTMYAMICCRDHHEYSTWTKKATTLVWMTLPMVQCILWSVVETFLNIQPGLKKTPHWYEPSNGTMYAMICCRDHHEYSTWTKKPTTLVWTLQWYNVCYGLL
jgi:uncharacterized membrane protein YhdT